LSESASAGSQNTLGLKQRDLHAKVEQALPFRAVDRFGRARSQVAQKGRRSKASHSVLTGEITGRSPGDHREITGRARGGFGERAQRGLATTIAGL